MSRAMMKLGSIWKMMRAGKMDAMKMLHGNQDQQTFRAMRGATTYPKTRY